MKTNELREHVDHYLEMMENADNYPERIEEKYQQLLENPDSLREAASWIAGTFDSGHETDTTLMLHAYAHEGMSTRVEHLFCTLSKIRAAELDAKLYEMAEESLREDDLRKAFDGDSWRTAA